MRFNKVVVTQLRHYKTKHQQNKHAFEQPFTYAYNIQVHWCAYTILYIPVQARQPLRPSSLYVTFLVPANAHNEASTQTLRQRLETRIRISRTHTNAGLQRTQGKYKAGYNRCVRERPTFCPDNRVFIYKLPLSREKSGIAENIATAA